jgi:hypothetical protein
MYQISYVSPWQTSLAPTASATSTSTAGTSFKASTASIAFQTLLSARTVDPGVPALSVVAECAVRLAAGALFAVAALGLALVLVEVGSLLVLTEIRVLLILV